MQSPDEIAAVVREARTGNARAFTTLARAFSRPIYAVALAHLGRPADAEDLAQDVLLAALSKLHTCREPAQFGAWIVRIARNRARNTLAHRRHADVPAFEPGETAIPGEQERACVRGELVAALAKLSEIQREVVLLHDLEGWTHPAIAAALDITDEASRQHLSRARRALRGHLDGRSEQSNGG